MRVYQVTPHGAPMASFAELLEPALDDLYAYACHLERDPVQADDLLQAGLLHGLKKHGQLREASAFSAWMKRVLRNTWVTARRKRTEIPITDTDVHSALRQVRGPEDTVRDARLGLQISAALKGLARERREAVWLVDGLGFSFSEAAKVLELPAGTVASRVSRGRSDLRLQLREVALDRGVIG